MITKKNIKELNFNSIEEYFKYMLNVKTNGEDHKYKELLNKLSIRQKDNFYHFKEKREKLIYAIIHMNTEV